jgi:MoxR-like ATPase
MLKTLLAALNQVILGKPEAVELLVAALLADGHALIEDLPGTGKTTLAKALALAIGAEFHRVQFTPDLMPADITGGSIFVPNQGEFRLQKGPVFTQVLLADEINRASPRTQSALLEAMEERQVSIDGEAMALPGLFWVLATQNPVEFNGVYPLPEAQMDRFMVRLSLGYPSEAEERRLLAERRFTLSRTPIPIGKISSPEDIAALQAQVTQVHVDADLDAYAVRLVRATRNHPALRLGASPRASLALIRLSQAFAVLDERGHILPEDIQRSLVPVMAHRIFAHDPAPGRTAEVLEEVRKKTAVPV